MKNVVVALDGSLNAEQALPIGAGIARRAGAQLTLLHALDYHATSYPDTASQTDFVCENTYDCARRYLERLADSAAQRFGVRAEIIIREGDALPVVLEYARSGDTDLIVMTTHGRGSIKRMWLGSVSDPLMRESEVPVLLIRPRDNAFVAPADEPFKHIVVPLDGSALAEDCLPMAIELAQESKAKLTLLHVLQPAVVAEMPGYTAALVATGGFGTDDQEASAAARDYLDKVRSRIAARLPDTETAVISSTLSVSSDITHYASDHMADLLAISTHGRGGFRRLILGSVTDQLVRIASIPVLVVRPSGNET